MTFENKKRLKHRREFNGVADHFANLTMDKRASWTSWDSAKWLRVRSKSNIMIFSDGGRRSTEGVSSSGWVIYAVSGDNFSVLGSGGVFINDRLTYSFLAEAIALEAAIQMLIDNTSFKRPFDLL